jgi:RNA polymerase sigma-70 factor (ECF subfamily)
MTLADPVVGKTSSSTEFETTHWSVVLQAGGNSTTTANAALDQLCHAYWLPLYAYARRRGNGPEDAQDLTQGFLAELIARRDLARVDRAKGTFRSFLLASFKHFLAKDWRERQALKRGGGRHLVSLDVVQAEKFLGAMPAADLPPDRLYDQRWAMAVMEQALERLRQEWVAADKEAMFVELRVFLTSTASQAGYEAVAARLNLKPPSVATTVHRLRKRYRELVRATLAQTVTGPLELEEEMRYLLEVLT